MQRDHTRLIMWRCSTIPSVVCNCRQCLKVCNLKMEKTAVSILSRYCFPAVTYVVRLPNCSLVPRHSCVGIIYAFIRSRYLLRHVTDTIWSLLIVLNEALQTASASAHVSILQERSLRLRATPPFIYLVRHWRYLRDKIDQTSPVSFCILQAVKTWVVRMPGNDASLMINGTVDKLSLSTNQSSRQLQTSHVYINTARENLKYAPSFEGPYPLCLPTCR